MSPPGVHERLPGLPNTPYRILPLSKIVRARVAIHGEDDEQWGPASVYALCDVQDGNYVLVDVASKRGLRRVSLVDVYKRCAVWAYIAGRRLPLKSAVSREAETRVRARSALRGIASP
jgi:hypothetical protein